MATWNECLDQIGQKSKIDWRPGEKEDMLEQIKAAKDSIMISRRLSDDEAFAQAAAEVANNKKIAAAIKHDVAMRNKMVRDRNTGWFERGADTLKELASRMTNTVSWGPRWDNVQNMQSVSRALHADMITELRQKIIALGAWKEYRKGQWDKDLIERVFKLSNGERLGNDTRDKVAQVLYNTQLTLRDRLNSVGAHIAEGTDRPGAAVWDRHALRRGGHGGAAIADAEESRSAFMTFFDKRLNWQRVMEHARTNSDEASKMQMDESPEDWKQRMLSSAWEAMVTGERKMHPGQEGFGGAYEGGLNVAKAVSEDRLFYFKDGQSWFEAMQKYGAARTFHENLEMSLLRGSRDYALMKMWGPSAWANAERVYEDLIKKYRPDVDAAEKVRRQVKGRGGFEQQFKRFDGSYSGVIGGNGETVMEATRNIRMFYDTTLLGGVGVTHLMSLPATLGSAIRYIGANRLEGFSRLFSNLMEGRSKVEASEIHAQLHVYHESVVRPIITEWSQMDWPGRISYMHSRFLDATGVHYFLDNAKRAVRETTAHYLAQEVEKGAWGANAKLAKALARYGFDADEWGMLRNIDKVKDEAGHTFLTTNGAGAIDDSLVQAHLTKLGQIAEDATPEAIAAKVKAWKQDFADRLGMFYQDMSDMSTVTAGVREQSLMRGTSQPGDLMGDLGQLILMFKSWPIAAVHQMILRDIYQSLDRRDLVGGIFGIAAASMIGGYGRMWIRAYADGKPPPDPHDLATWLAALAQGGGIGILGDVAFGETNRMGSDSLLAALGGPVVGDLSALLNAVSVQDLLKLKSHYEEQMDEGKLEDIWPQLAMWAKNHVPGNNLIYLKGAFDYLAWYHVLDVLRPGWWERANEKSIHDHGEPMAGYQPGMPAPYMKLPWGLPTYQPPHQ